jgi:hypothetical protein
MNSPLLPDSAMRETRQYIPGNSRVVYPTSHQQRWDFLRNSSKRQGDSLFKITMVETIPEGDPEIIRKIFAILINRHTALRAQLLELDGEIRMVIRDYDPEFFEILFFDHRGEKDVTGNINASIHEESIRLIDFDNEPYIRVHAYKVDTTSHVLAVFVEHIIADAFSLAVLRDEFIELHEGLSNKGIVPMLQPAVQITDFIRYKNDVVNSAANLEYWSHRKNDRSFDVDISKGYEQAKLPYAPANDDVERALVGYLDEGTFRQLNKLSVSLRVGLPAMVFGLINVFFSKFFQHPKIMTGQIFHSRDRSEWKSVIANCVEPIFVFSHLAPESKVTSAIADINRNFYRSVKFPYPWNINEDPFAISNVAVLNFFDRERNLYDQGAIADANERTHLTRDRCKRSELSWYFVVTERSNGLQFTCAYSNNYYSPALADKMFDALIDLSKQVVANPDLRIDAIKLFP